MYIARRAFRNYGQMVLPGSLVEPGNTKWFKTRLKDRLIVEVNEHNFDEWAAYFRGKLNVELPAITKPVKAEPVKAEPVKAEPVKAEPVKVVVKAN